MSNMKNAIIQGDTLQLLKKVPGPIFRVDYSGSTVYNIGKNFGIDRNFKDISVWREWCRKWLIECHRILKKKGSLFVYGIHKYICYLQVDLMEMGMEYGRLFIWNYENGFAGYTKKPAAHYEPLLWMTKSKRFCIYTNPRTLQK